MQKLMMKGKREVVLLLDKEIKVKREVAMLLDKEMKEVVLVMGSESGTVDDELPRT